MPFDVAARDGVLTLTLIAAIVGALAGVPSLHTWRARWAHSGAV